MGFSGRFSLEPIPSKIGKIGNWKQTYTNTEHPGINKTCQNPKPWIKRTYLDELGWIWGKTY